jgi:hypothetical protein
MNSLNIDATKDFQINIWGGADDIQSIEVVEIKDSRYYGKRKEYKSGNVLITLWSEEAKSETEVRSSDIKEAD